MLRGDGDPLVCEAIHLPLSLSTMVRENGELHAGLHGALRRAGLLDRSSEDALPVAQRSLQQWLVRQRFAAPPLVVLAIGALDVAAALLQLPADDFLLPPHVALHPLAPALVEEPSGPLDCDGAAHWFIHRVHSLQLAFERLRGEYGVRLAFLAIPPPPVDDAAAVKTVRNLGGTLTEARAKAAFRYKAAMYLNGLVAEVSAAQDVKFLDTWPILTRDGLARKELLVDALHLTEEAVSEILVRLIAPIA